MKRPDVITQTPNTVSLADEEAVKQLLVSTVFGLWDIVNNLTRLRPSKRARYRVMIFGSARAKPGTFVYDEVKRVAAGVGGGIRRRNPLVGRLHQSRPAAGNDVAAHLPTGRRPC